MKFEKLNFAILSREDMRNIVGGLGSVTVDCGGGRTVQCKGNTCSAYDYNYFDSDLSGHCICWTDDGSIPGNPDVQTC